MYFLYQKEYRVFKPTEITRRKDLEERRKIEGMKQIGLYNLITWKCQNETPCRDILNK
jgi:hypothetical protein